MYRYEVANRGKVETPDFAHAVLRHWLCKPIKLLMVPPIPTIPSSRSRYLSAEMGEVKSQTSESSWVRAVERSLEQTMLATLTNMAKRKKKKKKRGTYFSIFLASTTPSPSLRSTVFSFSCNLHSEYRPEIALKTKPAIQHR